MNNALGLEYSSPADNSVGSHEMLITADQVLAQMREQRRTFKSNDGSGYSASEIQELTATDFSAMIHKHAKRAQVSGMN
jgi:hypothetical protein